jgi:hypothetical protein
MNYENSQKGILTDLILKNLIEAQTKANFMLDKI